MYRLHCRRWLLLVVALLTASIFASEASAQVRVRGYYRKDGTYVQPHYRSYPDGNFYNNWSTAGNVNPYTGKRGTRTNPPSNYGRDVYVRGYTRSDGTYVRPHYRSNPDGNPWNNWSTEGNVNPYTGDAGTRRVESYTRSYGYYRSNPDGNYSSYNWHNNSDSRPYYGDEGTHRPTIKVPEPQVTLYRNWETPDGKYSAVARMLNYDRESVLLLREDSQREVRVPLERLSYYDRRYLVHYVHREQWRQSLSEQARAAQLAAQ